MAEYNIVKSHTAFQVGHLSHVSSLQAGYIMLFLKMNLNFGVYLEDQSSFEDKIKLEILNVIGLGPDHVGTDCAGGLKKHLTIKKVTQGSIEILVIVGGIL